MNQKKLQILQAAKELFFKNGFSDTSVADIIALAKVSKGTFYNHFSSKNDCMIAIFQDIHEQSVSEREIVVHFHNKYDIATLEKELTIHFKIIIESNIMDIMANSISSKEQQDIFDLIKSKSIREIDWLGSRLLDVYGTHIKNNAYDFAAMILASIQQITLIRTILIPTNFIIDDIVKETLKKFEPGIFARETTGSPLIPKELLNLKKQSNDNEKKITLKEIIKEIELFYEENYLFFTEDNKEYTLFLITLLKQESEKSKVIESLNYSFINSFKNGHLYSKALGIFQEIQQII